MTAQIEDRFYFERRVFSVVDACGGTLFNPQDFGLYVASADDACRRGYVAEFALDEEKRLTVRNLCAAPLDCKSELGRLAVERLRKKRELAATLADFEADEANAARLRAEIAALEAEFPGFDNEDDFHRELLARRPDEAGLLDGAAPSLLVDEDVSAGCRFLYEECNLPLDYTGTILLGADCVAEQSVGDALDGGNGESAESSGGATEETTSYKTLLELDFENGFLQTATDCSNFGAPRPNLEIEAERAAETLNDALSVADWLERAFDVDFLAQWERKKVD
ncbi:MAG: hypothetical protein IKW13_07380 [Thermoguttaceae bacterium]|nr:hypothetical protein [Thermoguttaceae bacterium]